MASIFAAKKRPLNAPIARKCQTVERLRRSDRPRADPSARSSARGRRLPVPSNEFLLPQPGPYKQPHTEQLQELRREDKGRPASGTELSINLRNREPQEQAVTAIRPRPNHNAQQP